MSSTQPGGFSPQATQHVCEAGHGEATVVVGNVRTARPGRDVFVVRHGFGPCHPLQVSDLTLTTTHFERLQENTVGPVVAR